VHTSSSSTSSPTPSFVVYLCVCAGATLIIQTFKKT
jgi:hypothetical protein